jgi:hypothetical protein
MSMNDSRSVSVPQAQMVVAKERGRYDVLREAAEQARRKGLFSINIEATTEDAFSDQEQQFLLDLVFKPNDPSFRLKPDDIQLLLGYIGDILTKLYNEEMVTQK